MSDVVPTPPPTPEAIAAWLTRHHAAPISDLTPLRGGFWSTAYAYRVGEQALVLRLGQSADWYAIDAAAMRFDSPALPVPKVLAIGAAFERAYAISERHFGRFLEDVDVAEADAAGATLARLLAALRAVPPLPGERVNWSDPPGAAGVTWRDWLRRPLDALPTGAALTPEIAAVYRACVARIDALLPHIPERRDLVHGDLLHQNVLLTADAARVTAVFSWKCSARGDFLYDVAWCTFWGAWHPGIAAGDVWRRTVTAPDLSAGDLHAAPLRHHVYELQIVATHFSWYVFTGDAANLQRAAAEAARILARGPL